MSTDAPSHGTPDEQRLLSGKRRAPRHRLSVAVQCIGPSGRSFSGRTSDLSRAGMLVDITDSEIQPVEGSINLFPFAARVAIQFPEGMDVRFSDGAVLTHANVVRLATKPGESRRIFLGCDFVPPLSDTDCRLLGIDPGKDETKAPVVIIATDCAVPKAQPPGAAAKAHTVHRPPAVPVVPPLAAAAARPAGKLSWRRLRRA